MPLGVPAVLDPYIPASLRAYSPCMAPISTVDAPQTWIWSLRHILSQRLTHAKTEGDYGFLIYTEYNISADDVYAWNSAVSSNCSSALWPGLGMRTALVSRADRLVTTTIHISSLISRHENDSYRSSPTTGLATLLVHLTVRILLVPRSDT